MPLDVDEVRKEEAHAQIKWGDAEINLTYLPNVPDMAFGERMSEAVNEDSADGMADLITEVIEKWDLTASGKALNPKEASDVKRVPNPVMAAMLDKVFNESNQGENRAARRNGSRGKSKAKSQE